MIALVPFKGIRNGKSRLSSVLDEEARSRLAVWMLERVLRSLGRSPSVARVVLVSRDEEARSVAGTLGAEAFAETSDGLNAALREAIASLGPPGEGGPAADGGRGVLVIPADLPLLSPEEVEAMAALGGGESPCVVAAPSRREDGTNALLLRPADALTPAFGPDSFRRHRANAESLGIPFKTYCSPGLGLDIDVPEDLEALRRALGPARSDELPAALRPGPVTSP